MIRHRRQTSTIDGFALPELLVVIIVAVVALAIAAVLLMPRSRGHRRAPQSQNHIQLRMVHQAMVAYAQGNKGHFPGLGPGGEDKDLAVEARLQVLLEAHYFTGHDLIASNESKVAWTNGPLTTAQYSYALLQVPAAGGRRREWADTLNSQAVVLSDRNTGTPAAPRSIWAAPTGQPAGEWRGSVVWNDNHVVFETTSTLATRYGGGAPNDTVTPSGQTRQGTDDLFTAAGNDDALMIHSGN